MYKWRNLNNKRHEIYSYFIMETIQKSKLLIYFCWIWELLTACYVYQGRIQDFKLGGAHFKKLRRAEGGTKIFGVFRVKNHHFTQKNHIFSNFRGERAGCAPPGSSPDLGVAGCRIILLPPPPGLQRKSKNHCGQLQCISSTLYSLTSINCVVTVRGVADCRNLTDGRTFGRTDGHQVFEQRA